MKSILKLRREESQSLIIVAFAIIALIGLVGLAVDLGLSYVERMRVRRAADAAALASAADLPLEGAAHVRALQYLQENNYPCGLTAQYSGNQLVYNCTDPDTRVEINLGYDGEFISGPSADDAERIIRINTVPYRDNTYVDNTANRIEVEVTAKVGLFFMRVLGFDNVFVSGRAVGENVNNLDVALVFDVSGSMEFDTLCYGCWTPDSGGGSRWPLPWGSNQYGLPTHCSGTGTFLTYGGQKYIIVEAEEYSRSNVAVDRAEYSVGKTYWVIQRNGGTTLNTTQLPAYMRNTSGGEGALGRDARGGYIAHFPYRNHVGSDGMGSNCTWADLNNGEMCLRDTWIYSVGGPFTTPRVDYDFTVPNNGTWYVWARGQGRDGGQGNLMWGVNRTPIASVRSDANTSFEVRNGLLYNAARRSDWRWVQLGSQYFNAGQTYELNLWAGGVGFALDRIIITTDSRTPAAAVNANSNFNAQVLGNTANIDNNRTDMACNPCDERFGGYPNPAPNGPPHCLVPQFADYPDLDIHKRYLHDIYDDEQPVRGAKEATARFIERFDPRYDQVGFVTYSTDAQIRSELECVRRLGTDNCNESVIAARVTNQVRASNAGGSTNIAHGIGLGIDVLSNQSGHYGRPGAAHIMVFMTDGEANQCAPLPNGTLDRSCSAPSSNPNPCYAQDFWPNNTGNSTTDRSKDCVVYYARLARNNGIVIYSITLGEGADIELMQYIAELTGGIHRHAPRPEQLDPIFDELYNRIFLRLVE